MAAAGIKGNLPTLDDLRVAESPPDPIWRLDSYQAALRPTRAAVQEVARRIAADMDWRAARPAESKATREDAARIEAEDRLSAVWQAGPRQTHTLINEEDYERGRVLADLHGPLLAALAEILDGLDEVIPNSRLAAMQEEEICALADQRSEAALSGWKWRAALAVRAGRPVPPPTPDDRRRQDPIWQRRQLRRLAGLTRQHLAAALGTIGRGGSPYADDYSLARRRERDAAAQAWAESQEWRPPGGGKPVPLAAIIAASRKGALSRLGAITAGIDEIATQAGLTAIFITLTLPPEWHPNPKIGRRRKGKVHGPTETDRAATRLWKRFRGRLAKSGIITLGLRVWEPHEDGCPHIHALLYVQVDQIQEVDRHCLALCHEPQHAPHLFGPPERVASRLVVINPKISKATSYISKYLTEDIDGDGDRAARVRATAGERGWRRFALLGVHGIGRVWQRIRTMKEAEIENAPLRVQAAWKALQEHKWGDALAAMGAIRGPGGHRLRLGYQTELADPTTGEIAPLVNKYGEPAKRAAWVVDTETPEWRMPLTRGGTIERRRKTLVVTVTERFPRDGARAPSQEEKKESFASAQWKALLRERETLPQWQKWCADGRRRLDQLREPLTGTASNTNTTTNFAAAEAA